MVLMRQLHDVVLGLLIFGVMVLNVMDVENDTGLSGSGGWNVLGRGTRYGND